MTPAIDIAHDEVLKLRQRVAELEAQLAANTTDSASDLASLADRLRESDARFRLIIENSPDSFYYQDIGLRYVWFVNVPSMLSVEAILGKTDHDLLPAVEADRLYAIKRQVIEQGISTHTDGMFSAAGGTYYYEVYFEPRRDPDGTIVGLIGYARNITERKQAEAALLESEARFRAAFENANVGICLVGLDGHLLRVNEAMCQMFGYRPDELEGMTVNTIAFPDDTGMSPAFIQSATAGTIRKTTFDKRYIHRQGHTVWASVSSSLIADQQGKPLYFISHLQDITRRMQDEAERQHDQEQLKVLINDRTAELEQVRRRVEAILNSSSDAIVLVHFEYGIEQTNPAFDKLFACTPDAYFGAPLTALLRPEDSIQIETAIQEAVAGARVEQLEVGALRQDGSGFDAEISLAQVVRNGSRQSSFVCVLRDITRRKQLENELRAALSEAQDMNVLKSKFISMVSHEFRTPLATIQSSTDILKRYSDRITDERRQKHLDKVQTQVRQLTDLMDDILLLNRAQTRGIECQPIPLDLELLCQDITCDMQLLTHTHSIRFLPDCVTTFVPVDPKLIRRALTNLISNAVKYSSPGSLVQVELNCGTQMITIRVRDTGIGIPEADQKHLFEDFFRASNVSSISGTGIGLTIVKRAVEAHGGTIEFESTEGAGTIFTINIPLAGAAPASD